MNYVLRVFSLPHQEQLCELNVKLETDEIFYLSKFIKIKVYQRTDIYYTSNPFFTIFHYFYDLCKKILFTHLSHIICDELKLKYRIIKIYKKMIFFQSHNGGKGK